jgi:hypothetical protein
MATSATIVPTPDQLHLRHLEATGTEITSVVQTTAASASCPVCGRLSRRVHSAVRPHGRRRVLAWGAS